MFILPKISFFLDANLFSPPILFQIYWPHGVECSPLLRKKNVIFSQLLNINRKLKNYLSIYLFSFINDNKTGEGDVIVMFGKVQQ